MEPSVLIVGAGTFGTSTAYHLAAKYKDPSRVTVIDRSRSPSKLAASIDINRIIRTDYPDPLYCNLANEALHSWFWALELQRFFHKVGWVYLEERGSDHAERVRAVIRERGFDTTRDIPTDELEKQWDIVKGVDTDRLASAYFNPEVGWCDAANATASFMTAAEKRGVQRVVGEVTEILLDSKSNRVEGVCTSDGRRLTADKIVFAVGAWTSNLLSPLEDALGIPYNDRIERQVQATGIVSAYYKVAGDDLKKLSSGATPIVVYGRQGEVIPPSREHALLKYNNSGATFVNTITTRTGHRISVPTTPEQSQYDVPAQLKRETEDTLTSKLLPRFAGGKQADHWRICWDARTPTEDWLLCKHPHAKLDNLFFAVGGSFHGYKFLPNAGKYMVNVLDGNSNGLEKDKAWAWKSGSDFERLLGDSAPSRELSDYGDDRDSSATRCKL